MRNAVSDQISHIEQHLAMCNQKLKGIKGSLLSQNKESGSGDSFILFPHCQYPFLDDDKRKCKMFKTVISCDISNTKLQKLMRIHHPNIINLQKITRGHPKPGLNSSTDVFYSFYFQTVPYSLKKIITANDSNPNLIFQLANLNFGKILRNVNGFLMKEGIYNLFKLQDIGITKQAQLKIYVSPLIVCGGLSLKMGNHKTVIASIDKLIGWWETSLSSHEVIHPINNKMLLLRIPGDLASEESIQNSLRQNDNKLTKQTNEDCIPPLRFSQPKELNFNRIKANCNLNSYPEQPLNNMQHQKIIKIDQEIKFFRQKLRPKTQRKRNSGCNQAIPEESTFGDKNDQRTKKLIGRMEQTLKSYQKANYTNPQNYASYTNPEPVQHINYINIYNNNLPEKNNNAKLHHYQPALAAEKKPNEPECPSPTNAKMPNLSQYDFGDGEGSVDTYQMELNPHYVDISEQPGINNRNNLISVDRELSQHTLKVKQSSNKFEGHKGNQVAKKNIYQSAGPLQFQHFVNQFIKPQFMAKKSNIYEDPGEYESQQSKSVSKSIKNNNHDFFESGKNVRPKIHKIDNSHQNMLNEQSLLAITDKPALNKKLQSIERGVSLKINSLLQKNNQIKLRRTNEGRKELIVNQKVKRVLEKTKAAIAQLNRTKTSLSFPFKLAAH